MFFSKKSLPIYIFIIILSCYAITYNMDSLKIFGQNSYYSIISKDNMSLNILKKFQDTINKHLKNGSNDISIVVGSISPGGAFVSSYGNLSKSDPIKVNGDTLFDIASITNTFTTLLFADMIEK